MKPALATQQGNVTEHGNVICTRELDEIVVVTHHSFAKCHFLESIVVSCY